MSIFIDAEKIISLILWTILQIMTGKWNTLQIEFTQDPLGDHAPPQKWIKPRKICEEYPRKVCHKAFKQKHGTEQWNWKAHNRKMELGKTQQTPVFGRGHQSVFLLLLLCSRQCLHHAQPTWWGGWQPESHRTIRLESQVWFVRFWYVFLIHLGVDIARLFEASCTKVFTTFEFASRQRRTTPFQRSESASGFFHGHGCLGLRTTSQAKTQSTPTGGKYSILRFFFKK